MPEHRHGVTSGIDTVPEAGADALGRLGNTLGPHAQGEEHGLGTLLFRAVESLSIVLRDLVVAGRYVDHHELALVFGAEPGADVALVDLPATQDDLLFRYARVGRASYRVLPGRRRGASCRLSYYQTWSSRKSSTLVLSPASGIGGWKSRRNTTPDSVERSYPRAGVCGARGSRGPGRCPAARRATPPAPRSASEPAPARP